MTVQAGARIGGIGRIGSGSGEAIDAAVDTLRGSN